jgi:hypothetical protein
MGPRGVERATHTLTIGGAHDLGVNDKPVTVATWPGLGLGFGPAGLPKTNIVQPVLTKNARDQVQG